ncbi:formyltetrahydrofolate deformylase [Sediminicola luteus]|uniref:Formyltetrahydrofolate deformylase n=1 Tax=Sediminicola luteus TaxID=319238 RepID=A0A2A4G8M4_9FLAO|nr:formyltetrahydrofolate deformylase [Sediminicola luteus]PCE64324.1 formyltetrahydrofolate deformylase [Sediminicola luteus]
MSRFTFLILCPDQVGIIAKTTAFLHQRKGNIVYLDQYVDPEAQMFFMRLECDGIGLSSDQLRSEFNEALAIPFQMQWRMDSDENLPKMALFVSKYDHCLYDILGRHAAGELQVEIPFIISNHPDLAPVAEQFGIPYHHIPVTKDTKPEAEAAQLALLEAHKIDLIVLARYMQIVSPKLIDRYPNRIINIHHSFLPAFPGAKPYHSAYARGVKIIGATSHYVTEDLDAGPIIEQDTTQVSHIHSVTDFIRKGRDLEKIVLSRAIRQHLEGKTMVYDNKTVIFH